MLYKLGFVWKWSDLEFRGENPRFSVKTVLEDEAGRRRGLERGSARSTTRAGDCFRNVFLMRNWFEVFLIGIL